MRSGGRNGKFGKKNCPLCLTEPKLAAGGRSEDEKRRILDLFREYERDFEKVAAQMPGKLLSRSDLVRVEKST